MASDDESWRWKDDFPQLFAAWLATQTVARRASDHVRSSAAAPSPWAIACFAGGFSVILAFVLLFVGPPEQPPVSIGNGLSQRLMTPSSPAKPLHTLELGVEWMAARTEWDESEQVVWPSVTVSRAVSAPAFVHDDWTAAAPRPPLKTPAMMPYYLRVQPIEFKDLVAAVSAAETPSLLANDEFAGDLHVTIDRSPAALTDNGLLAYTLHVQNLGPDEIDHVRVIETVPQAEHVVNTVPPAAVTVDGAFVWELDHLAGAETRDLQVILDPTQVSAPIDTIAALDVETQVAVKTLVAAAALPPAVEEKPVTAEALPTDIPPDIARPTTILFAAQPADAAPPAAQPSAAIVPVDEPIVPEFANDRPPASGDQPPAGQDKWSPSGPAATSADEAPISPQFGDDDPPPAPKRPEPRRPNYEPLAPLPRRPAAPVANDTVEPTPETPPRPLPANPKQPARPILSVAGTSDAAVRTGDVVTTVYEIANTGDAPAEGVLLTVFVPAELQHKHGDQVQHRIDRLLPGQSHKARLLTRAATEGTARLDAVLSHDGQSDGESVVSVRVIGSQPSSAPRTSPGASK